MKAVLRIILQLICEEPFSEQQMLLFTEYIVWVIKKENAFPLDF